MKQSYIVHFTFSFFLSAHPREVIGHFQSFFSAHNPVFLSVAEFGGILSKYLSPREYSFENRCWEYSILANIFVGVIFKTNSVNT